MKCQIKWISKEGLATPDENEAVAMAHHHESIWSHPGGHFDNHIVGYKPDVITDSFPICAAHLGTVAPYSRIRLECGGGWTFTPLAENGQ